MFNVFKNFFDYNQREINRLQKKVDEINKLEEKTRDLKQSKPTTVNLKKFFPGHLPWPVKRPGGRSGSDILTSSF